MLRPRPVPSPTSRVVKNGSKMRRRFSSGMPWPVSRDEQLDGGGLFDIARADAQAPRRPAPHRLLGVENQVQQRLLQLAAVGRAPAADSARRRSRARCRSDEIRRRAARARGRPDPRGPAARARPSGGGQRRAGCGRSRAARSDSSAMRRRSRARSVVGRDRLDRETSTQLVLERAARSRSRWSADCSARAPRRRRVGRSPTASPPGAAAPEWSSDGRRWPGAARWWRRARRSCVAAGVRSRSRASRSWQSGRSRRRPARRAPGQVVTL